MVKKKLFSESKKVAISTHAQHGMTPTKIANLVCRVRSIVTKYLIGLTRRKKAEKKEIIAIITKADKRNIARYATVLKRPSRTTISMLPLKVYTRRVQQILKGAPPTVYIIQKHLSCLTTEHKHI